MPTIIFWILVFAVVMFFKLSTKAERRTMIENYWAIIILLGAAGFLWQILAKGTISV